MTSFKTELLMLIGAGKNYKTISKEVGLQSSQTDGAEIKEIQRRCYLQKAVVVQLRSHGIVREFANEHELTSKQLKASPTLASVHESIRRSLNSSDVPGTVARRKRSKKNTSAHLQFAKDHKDMPEGCAWKISGFLSHKMALQL